MRLANPNPNPNPNPSQVRLALAGSKPLEWVATKRDAEYVPPELARSTQVGGGGAGGGGAGGGGAAAAAPTAHGETKAEGGLRLVA